MRARIHLVIAVLLGLTVAGLTATPAVAVACNAATFTSSEPDGMWSDGDYIVANDMWNAGGYDVDQRLTACTYRDWSATVTADDSSGDGAVKTYPNVHRDYIDWSSNAAPALSSFSTITSRFAATTPDQGVYDAAYDIWLNQLDREVMVWTTNRGQTPSGQQVATVTLSGHTWSVWATSDNSYVAFVPSSPIAGDTLDLKSMLGWLTTQGRLPTSATLTQICYGFEVVSTDGSPATFAVSDFDVTTG